MVVLDLVLTWLEAGRSVLLRRVGEARGAWREPIPLIRWLLAPWRTLLLWRRMALWQLTSYRTAIDTEPQVRRAITAAEGVVHSEVGTSEGPPMRVPMSDSSCVRPDDPPLLVDEVDDRLDEALHLNRRHWRETGRPISAETLRQRLHISASAWSLPPDELTARTT